jgi:hypothetical protein
MSLKKTPKSGKSSSARNFFNTLGGPADEETTMTLPSPTLVADEAPTTKKFVDPLAKFDPVSVL